MDEEKKDKREITFKIVLTILFLIYICLYFVKKGGYYNEYLRHEVNLTNEQIIKFEEDIKEGKETDIINYIDVSSNDYSNSISRLGYNISTNLDDLFVKGILKASELLKKFMS